jgi:hypothetical protein
MATAYTVTITNTNTSPLVLQDTISLVTISPTGITTPDTPYTEYISDSATITDGSIFVPLYNRTQICKLPAGKALTIGTDNTQEAVYYQLLTLEGATIEVTGAPIDDAG